MAVLAYAIQTRDAELLLQCFAHDVSWFSVNTVEKPWPRTKMTYARLAAGLQSAADFRDYFFGEDADDSFRNYFIGENRGAWHSVEPLMFSPAASSPEQLTYVRWRKAGARYAVSEIAFPAD